MQKLKTGHCPLRVCLPFFYFPRRIMIAFRALFMHEHRTHTTHTLTHSYTHIQLYINTHAQSGLLPHPTHIPHTSKLAGCVHNTTILLSCTEYRYGSDVHYSVLSWSGSNRRALTLCRRTEILTSVSTTTKYEHKRTHSRIALIVQFQNIIVQKTVHN